MTSSTGALFLCFSLLRLEQGPWRNLQVNIQIHILNQHISYPFLQDSIVSNFNLKSNSTSFHNFEFGQLFAGITNSLVELKPESVISRTKIVNQFHLTNFTEMSKEEIMDSFESMELSDSGSEELFESLEDLLNSSEESSSEELLESIEDLLDDNIDNNTINALSEKFTVMKEDCGEEACKFLFAGTEMTDQSVGKL